MISKFEEWGILKKVRDKDGGLFRVERIIKAKLPPEKLAEVKDQIKIARSNEKIKEMCHMLKISNKK